MENIFSSQGKREKKLAVELLSLLAKDKGRYIIDYYRKNYNMSIKSKFSREDIILLLTTCWFKRAFYSHALGISMDIVSELAGEEKIPDTEDENKQKRFRNNKKNFKYVDIIFNDRIMKEEKNAATPADNDDDTGWEEIFTKSITYKDISGTLALIGDQQKRVYLEFSFDKCKEKITEVPFELEFCFKTVNGPKDKDYILIANNPRESMAGNITAISSDISSEEQGDIDCSGGIEANSKVNLKILTK
jgi:hypothetical protein